MRSRNILVVAFLLMLNACSVEEFYFQTPAFVQSKVYKFECKKDSNKTQYWKITANHQEHTLVTEAYDSNFQKFEYFKEKITKKGSKLLEYISFHYDGEKIISSIQTPIERDVFKFTIDKPYKYSVKRFDKKYGIIIFQKKRKYFGKEKISIFGRKSNAIIFKENYSTEIESTKQRYEYKQYSYYVKGYGLVKMEKDFSNGEKLVLELTEIIPKDAWIKMTNNIE